MDLNDILRELSVFGQDQPVPRQALAEAARQREAITPYLMDALETVYQGVQEIGDEVCNGPTYDLSYYALFLLAQFREQQAFPKLLQLLTLDEDALNIVLGDSVSEAMPKALYSTFNGDIQALQAVIANDMLSPHARGAALRAWSGVLRDGGLTREDAVSFFRERLSALGTGCDDAYFGALLASQIADNDLYELAEDVRETYRQGKIDLQFIGGFEDFFDYLYNKAHDSHFVKAIEDAAEELSAWACFLREPEPGKRTSQELLSWNVGRNDPCPCGSGKKFKKCCLPKKEVLEMKLNPSEDKLFSNEYPSIYQQGIRPGLSAFYSRDAIAVDRLAYQGMRRLRYGIFLPEKEVRQRKKEAKQLLWSAFEKYQSVCEKNSLETPEAYDAEHRVHYLSRTWLKTLKELLEESRDQRLEEVKKALS